MPFVGFAFTDSALDFLEELPPKHRRQVARKAKALHANPFPPTSKKLNDIETPSGESVYRERSGDYRILYVVRSNPAEVIILDIDNRKDVYRMPKTKTEPADEMRMKQGDFDNMMRSALGTAAPKEKKPSSPEKGPNPTTKRLSSYPAKQRRN